MNAKQNEKTVGQKKVETKAAAQQPAATKAPKAEKAKVKKGPQVVAVEREALVDVGAGKKLTMKVTLFRASAEVMKALQVEEAPEFPTRKAANGWIKEKRKAQRKGNPFKQVQKKAAAFKRAVEAWRKVLAEVSLNDDTKDGIASVEGLVAAAEEIAELATI